MNICNRFGWNFAHTSGLAIGRDHFWIPVIAQMGLPGRAARWMAPNKLPYGLGRCKSVIGEQTLVRRSKAWSRSKVTRSISLPLFQQAIYHLPTRSFAFMSTVTTIWGPKRASVWPEFRHIGPGKKPILFLNSVCCLNGCDRAARWTPPNGAQWLEQVKKFVVGQGCSTFLRWRSSFLKGQSILETS